MDKKDVSNQCAGCKEVFSEYSTLVSHIKKYKRCRASYCKDEDKEQLELAYTPNENFDISKTR